MSHLSAAFSQRLLGPIWPDLTLWVSLRDANDSVMVRKPLTGLAVVDGWARADSVWFDTAVARSVKDIVIVEEANLALPIVTLNSAVAKPSPSTAVPFWLVWQGNGIFRL